MKIIPYTKNAKKHPAAQVAKIAASIKEFGMNQPIVVDKEGVIIVGHGRYEALKSLEWEIKPEWVLTLDLTPEQAKAYRLADNKLNESDWDMDLVIEELRELSEPMLDLTGFSSDLLLEDDEKDNDVPELGAQSSTEFGDLFEVGGHRILCGDAVRAESWERLMNGRKGEMLLTDPPYNVGYIGKTAEELTIENDVMEDSKFIEFIRDALLLSKDAINDGAAFYLWHADLKGLEFRSACKEAGLQVRQCLIWNKNTMVLGRQDYQWKHEPCLYGWKDGATHTWNNDRKQTTILDFNKPSKSESHPTMKPVELFASLIVNSSVLEKIVVDPFLGSGTTLIAAEKTGRVCYGMELDPKYVDVIVQRYVDYTGINEIIKNGETILWPRKTAPKQHE